MVEVLVTIENGNVQFETRSSSKEFQEGHFALHMQLFLSTTSLKIVIFCATILNSFECVDKDLKVLN